MKTATCKLKSLSPYNQSRQHFTEKKDKETHADWEERTWREKGHYDAKGESFIPPMAFKGCLAESAKMLGISIPGKGKSLYTKHFKAGVMVTDPVGLGVKKSDVEPQWVSCDPQGRKGGMGVLRAFPHYESWEGEVVFHVLDDTITEEVFERVLKEAGSFVGIGQFRPANGGYFGRFEVESVEWS